MPIDGQSELTTDLGPLLGSGIGFYRFGLYDNFVIDGLSVQLGARTSDERSEYPEPNNIDGGWVDDEVGFDYRHERTTCWQDVCLIFGGGARDRLHFVGWQMSGTEPAVLSASGVRVGDSQAERLDVLEMQWACFSEAYAYTVWGRAAIVLQGPDAFYTLMDAISWGDGVEPITTDPDPAEVFVTSMFAGIAPYGIDDDC